MVKFLLILFVVFAGPALERLERKNSSVFWRISVLLGLIFSFSSCADPELQISSSSIVIEKNISSVLAVNSGGQKSEEDFVYQMGLEKNKEFYIDFHRRLENNFPDWEARINYQKKQEEVYKAVIKKTKAYRRLGYPDNQISYTRIELDAIDYFNGTGFYKQYQDLKEQPNMFDTRQTFLLKMHDPVKRKKFLDNFNRFNRKND